MEVLTNESPPKFGGRRADPRKKRKCSIPKGLGLYQLGFSGRLFVAPGHWFVTAVWFRYDDTDSQWYWTPFTMEDVSHFDQMWIPVAQTKVPNGMEVHDLVASIIQYLHKENPHPATFQCSGHPIAVSVTLKDEV